MAEATFSLAVENLGILLIENGDILPLHIQREARELRDELERMQFFLRDAAERQHIGRAISQLREVAQDAEDFIQTFSSDDSTTTIFSGINFLRERLRGITNMIDRYNRGALEDSEWQVIPTTPWHIVEHVVGFEQDVELLLNRAILQDRTGLSVDAIVGLGGIGKTTLARLVYNNENVTWGYDHRIWIYVSSQSSLEEIMKKLLLQLLGQGKDELQMLQSIERLRLPELQLLLQRRLVGKRYLIVLDDVQEISARAIRGVLPNEGNGSRLLITSCNRNIKNQAD